MTGTRWPRPIAALRHDLAEGVATAEELLAKAHAAQLAADDGPDPVHAFLCHDFTPPPHHPPPPRPPPGAAGAGGPPRPPATDAGLAQGERADYGVRPPGWRLPGETHVGRVRLQVETALEQESGGGFPDESWAAP